MLAINDGNPRAPTLAPVLSRHGALALRPSEDTAAMDGALGVRIEQAFTQGAGHGLLHLGANEVATTLPPLLAYWRDFGKRYVTALCALPGLGEGRTKPAVPLPAETELLQVA